MSTAQTSITAADAQAAFEKAFGYNCSGVWSAPGRVNIIGEHVDYAGGLCLPFAINRRTYCAAARRTDGIIRLVSQLPGKEKMSRWSGALRSVAPGSPSGWPAYPAGVMWAMWQDAEALSLDCDEHTGFDMVFLSDVPLGAGLSSSAAIELAAACAIIDLCGPGLESLASDRRDDVSQHIIDACIRAENDVVGASTGGLDQSCSFRGQEGYALKLDMGTGSVDPVSFNLDAQGLAILVMNTNAPHSLGDGQYGSRRAIVDRVLEGLSITAPHREENIFHRIAEWAATQPEAQGTEEEAQKWKDLVHRRLRHVVTESGRTERLATLVDNAETLPVEDVGELMVQSHVSLRDDYEVSCPELDSAVDAALAHGAWGARMTGGGFGGSAIALAATEDLEKIQEAVRAAAEEKSLATPDFIVAIPSQGARREEI